MKIKENKFTWAMILFTFVLFWNNFAGTTSNINTTMLAFHYGYGFISRGLLGTLYGVLNRILPWDLYTFGWAMLFFGLCCITFPLLYEVSENERRKGKTECPVFYHLIFYCSDPYVFQ